ncbi:TolC family protein [Nitrospira sp. Kam-Ns4a]
MVTRSRPIGRFVGAIAMVVSLFGAAAEAVEPSPPSYDLRDIIALALERNPRVLGAEGVMEQRRGEKIAAGAYPNPSLYGQTGRGTIQDPPTGGPIAENAFVLNQPVEWPGMRAARKRVADAALAGASAGLEEARLDLIADVKLAFYELLLAQRGEELARQNLATVEHVARIVTARVRSGEGAQFEVIKADVEVLKANQVVTRAQNAVRVARVALDTLTAGALGTVYMIRGDFQPFQRDLSLDTLVTTALEQHPTIRRLAKLVEASGQNVELQRQARVPTVTVSGMYFREAGREAFGGALTVPTPLWYRRQGEIASALGAKRREEAELLRAQNELVRQVNQHFQDAKTAAEQLEVFEKGLLKQAQEALRIAQFSFQQGVSSLLEVLDAQRVFRQTQLEHAQARYEFSVALTRLERSVGGRL